MGFWPDKAARGEGSLWPAVLIGLFASIGGILFGYDTATISGIQTMKFWIKTMATQDDPSTGEPALTTNQTSLIVSILSAGTFFGALLAGPAGDFFGRRWGLVVSCAVFIVGVVLQTAATAIPLFVAGRLVAGLGVGLVSALVPLYQSESAPKWVRGTIVGTYQLCINVGLVVAAAINKGTGYDDNSGSYRIPVAVQILFGLLLAGGMLFLPETPRYLVQIGKIDRAKAALGFLHGLPVDHPLLREELREIEDNLAVERAKGGGYLACWSPPFLKRQLTGCVLQSLQQLSGINFIIYYGTKFFNTIGVADAFTTTIIINVVAFVSTIPGLYLVETMGRRKLLLLGAAGMALMQLIVGIIGVSTSSDAANKAVISIICLYIFCFEFSWGPCAWVVTGEIFPLHIRAKALSMTTASNWLWNFILGFVTPYMVDAGPHNADLGFKVFFIWTAFCIIAVFFVWGFIYETKGLSLEEVDEMFLRCGQAYKSPAFRRENPQILQHASSAAAVESPSKSGEPSVAEV
ncbi:General substrate transporter [Niveomyces insectorum RCEF 264]|uniref:General substrate transporter n=1 Tax=Niveomyces insectorum RCEF 264 TaxID=1081102 RepID=A0A167PTJ4_9HYPO|nr:General substrate transporter [Niveomyces insectorum RCEF 264]